MERSLKELTIKLIDYLNQGLEQFDRTKTTGTEGDFYLEVKPFADSVKIDSEKWLSQAIKWANVNKPQFINEKQLETTFDHIQNIAIQSFYPKTSRKRFLSFAQSAKYVLDSIMFQIDHMDKENKKGLE